jgi:hypothetical protein
MIILLQENLKRINYCRTRVNGKKFHPKRPSRQSCWNGERRKSDDDAMDQGVRQVSVAMPFIAMQLRSTKKREKGGRNPSLIDVILGCDLLQVGCKVIWGRMSRVDDVQPQSFGVGNTTPHNSALVNSHYIVTSLKFMWLFDPFQ